jgi:hypothetical protein
MAKGRSKQQQGRYSSYKASQTWMSNRRKRLEKTAREQPNNEQVIKALKNITYRRKTPNSRVWSSTMRRTAVLFKMFEGSVNMAIFSANDIARTTAVMSHKQKGKYAGSIKTMFSIGARAHHKLGELIW